jgi:hypothetical protein
MILKINNDYIIKLLAGNLPHEIPYQERQHCFGIMFLHRRTENDSQFIHRLLSNDHRYKQSERLFFLLNIDTQYFRPSVDRNVVLRENTEPTSSAVAVAMRVRHTDLIGPWRAKG